MHAMSTRLLTAVTIAGVAVAGCTVVAPAPAPAPAPAAAATGAPVITLVTRLGNDTLAVEQYTRTDSRMDGVLVTRAPVAAISRYSVQLGAGSVPVSAEYSVRRGDGSMIPGTMPSLSIRLGADSVTMTGHRAAGDTVRTTAASGLLLPYVNSSHGLLELAIARLRASGRTSASFGLLPMNFNVRNTAPLPFELLGSDSVRYDWFGSPFYGRYDARGGLLVLDGRQTTDKVLVERASPTDLDALAARWNAAGPVGRASPHDSVVATVGAAHVRIDYGRPALRGRDVWVNGVLGDTLWRTGADSATFLTTDRDLVIGGAAVPAGRYSLFTATTPAGYRLVINRQTGQWGTDYTRSMDLARVPLTETNGAPVAERFTISIEPQGTASALVLAWGTRRLSVPVSAR